MKKYFSVVFLEEVLNFFDIIDEKARDKIIFNIDKASKRNDTKLFKKLTSDIWEFRTLYNNTHYRVFAFWDKTIKTKTLVIATHGIIKRTKKTPGKEIEKIKAIRRLYFIEKQNEL